MQEVPYPTLWNGILVVSISFWGEQRPIRRKPVYRMIYPVMHVAIRERDAR